MIRERRDERPGSSRRLDPLTPPPISGEMAYELRRLRMTATQRDRLELAQHYRETHMVSGPSKELLIAAGAARRVLPAVAEGRT